MITSSLSPSCQAKNQSSREHRSELRPTQLHPSNSLLHLVGQEGQLQVHTAPYRGSFSVVLSEALRAAGLGRKVMVTQFLKGGVSQGPSGLVRLCGRLEWLRPAIPFCLEESTHSETNQIDKSIAMKAVEEVWDVCKNRILSSKLDQLVLDEVGLAISLGYLKEEDLINTLEQRPGSMDVILTGPSIPSRVISMADQVTELRCGY